MADWKWLRADFVRALHREGIAEHGGVDGLRDEGLLESALSRPQNLLAYGEPDAAALAAAYAYGLARNHPFVDGNKRAAAFSGIAFLNLNGLATDIDDGELVLTILALAAGDLSEEELATWFRERIAA